MKSLNMKTSEIRTLFLNYFKSLNHTLVSPSSLVPQNDPTLLFTNAGMNQFKETFLGAEKRNYNISASCQPCVRAGGKHNDLENVGFTARHHTFFEMLGNFSFGAYFKKEAIEFAWNFLTQELNISPERLWVTVYKDDIETENIWLNTIKINKNRISRCGDADNFWMMGETGPCGPCTEIFYDHGEAVAGGPPGSPDSDGDRYVEIWNLVFMQFNAQSDGTRMPLPKPSVDTGMGLERISAVMQGVTSNYETDIFQHLIKATALIAKILDLNNKSLRVISDHIRATVFLISDGVSPGNEGRAYVLRRIMR
ncbi:MAG: alaS1, partial [Francisellaceae bacterium]|nr:alaS1 [Francisellaceae bacterium]